MKASRWIGPGGGDQVLHDFMTLDFLIDVSRSEGTLSVGVGMERFGVEVEDTSLVCRSESNKDLIRRFLWKKSRSRLKSPM